MTPDEKFFYDHAGFSWNPEVETREQGRERWAAKLAAAETVYLQAHRVADVHCEWANDADGWSDWESDERRGYNSGETKPERIETCTMWYDHDGKLECLASLSAIQDADENYRRVTRAELALECVERLAQIVKENEA